MKFDFFKKKRDNEGKGKGDLFDPTEDGLDFDELEASGEFLSGENFAPPPPPPAPTPPPRATPPVRSAPLPPPHPRPAPPRPAPSRPAPSAHDDLTILNLPPDLPRPGGGNPSPPPSPPSVSAPVPPGPPRRPAAPSRPATPPAAPVPPPQQARPQEPVAQDDDVTRILNNPVGLEPVVAWLVVANGPFRGQDFRLPSGQARIGIDAQCDIVVPGDTYISGRHADISFFEGQYQIRDLDSTNGSFVNEVRISESFLRDDDRLRLGQTTFVFKSLNL